jgi:hypothetical protein
MRGEFDSIVSLVPERLIRLDRSRTNVDRPFGWDELPKNPSKECRVLTDWCPVELLQRLPSNLQSVNPSLAPKRHH